MKKTISIFEKNNVIVVGLPRRGKDMLMGNVIARRGLPYASNTDYHCKAQYYPLDFNALDIKNDYTDFISGNLHHYEYPYPENCSIYVGDAGVYLPSQYCSELNKKYPRLPYFMALIGHLSRGKAKFYANIQNLNRLWDKFREMADVYLNCQWCKVFFRKFVIQKYIYYDKYQSCVDRVKPYKHIRVPLFASKELRALLRQKDEEMKRLFVQNYGTVKSRILIYFNRSNYDTHIFKEMLKNAKN